LNSSQPTTAIKRPNTVSQNKTFEMAKALERANLYLIILASVLFLNVLASALLFLRGNTAETAAAAPAAMPQWDKDEILGKLKTIEQDLAKAKSDLAQQKAIVTRMQTVADALQVAVSRIPAPIEGHSVVPQVQPPPAEQR
jgi:hypothetical protein